MASQQWIVAKNGNETATLTLSADMTGAKYLMVPMISTISPFYTSISAALSDGTVTESFTLADQLGGLLHRAVAGQWEFNNHMLQFGGTLTLASFASIAINVDNSSSGNIRSVLNHYIDAMYYGTGRTISGTTTTDKLFKESNDLNTSSDTFDGCTLEFSGGIDAQTDVTISTTLGNSYGETLTFREVANTDNIYTLSVTGTADFQANAIAAATSNVTVNLDASTATAFNFVGNSLVGAGTTEFKLGQNIKGSVLTGRTSITHNSSTFEGNTVNTSGIMTVATGGSCTGNTFNNASGISAISVTSLASIGSNNFVSDGSNHAIELTSIGGGSMVWNSTTSGYATGLTGSPVTPTATGNEDLFVNVASGTLTVNVTDGATIPSIRSAGATINVVAGQKNFQFTVSPLPTPNYEWRLYTVTAEGSLLGAVELAGEESATTATKTYTHSFTNQPVAVQIISDDYIEETFYTTLTPTDLSVTINLKVDNND